MSTIKKETTRRLKQKNSSSTEGTIEGNGFSGIQINVQPPKIKKTYEISEAIRMRDLESLEDPYQFRLSQNEKNLIGVPSLAKKRDEGSVFDTRNIKSTITSNLKSRLNPSFSGEEVRETNKTDSSNVLTYLIDEETPNEDYIMDDSRNNNVFINSLADFKPQKSGINNPQERREEELSKRSNKKPLKKYMSLNEFKPQNQESRINISIEDDIEASSLEPQQMKINIKQTKHQKDEKTLKDKENMLALLKKPESSGRMTLRDYIYQTEISSKKALKTVKESEEEQEKKQKKPEGRRLHKRMSMLSPQYKSSKYGISTVDMSIELKKDICQQITQMINRLKAIQQMMKDPSEDHQNISHQELMLLYNTRRNLKNHIHHSVASVQEQLSSWKETAKNEKMLSSSLQFKEI